MEKRKKAEVRSPRKVHASMPFLDMYTLPFLSASEPRNISETSSEPRTERNAQLLSIMNPLLGSPPMQQQDTLYHVLAAYMLSSAQANPLLVTSNHQLDPALSWIAASTQFPPEYTYTSSNPQTLALDQQLLLRASWMYRKDWNLIPRNF
jgi:hypothetical protein